jgi:hypothetical protein
MSKQIISSFGELNEKQIKSLKDAIKEMSDLMTIMDGQRSAMKSVLDEISEEINVPKKIIRRLAKTYHKNNYDEVTLENSEFETLYSEVLSTTEN